MSRLAKLPVHLPEVPVPNDTQASAVAEACGNLFENLAESSFLADAVWRDTYILTGTLRTFYGAESIVRAWSECTKLVEPLKILPILEAARQVDLPQGSSWIELSFAFETAAAPALTGTAHTSLVWDPKEDNWKIWTMRTVLDDIKETKMDYSSIGTTQGGSQVNFHASNAFEFDCVVVGAGQAGLDTAAYCAAWGLAYVVLEKNHRVGDNWRQRYDSARLHTIREYSHLPYDRTFDDSYPEYLGKDDLADAYEKYVERKNTNVWLSTSLLSGEWDEGRRAWTLTLDSNGRQKKVVSSFVVLAVGAGGQIPVLPDLPGKEKFRGTVLHSEQYKSPKAFAGRHGVVVGSANTAHDVAEDMLDAGLATTTMVQRSQTYIVPREWFVQTQSSMYNPYIPTELADKLGFSPPHAVLRVIGMSVMHSFARRDMARFEALEKVGFKVSVFGDPVYHLMERLGGHYMDVGASAKIAAGKIKVKSDAALTHYTEDGLGFADGSEIPADLVVFATGFDLNMRNRVAEIFGNGVADLFGDFTTFNDEGEFEGAYKFCHPGLACVGGAIGPARWYSKLLTLHMKAAAIGKPFKPYRGEERKASKSQRADNGQLNGFAA